MFLFALRSRLDDLFAPLPPVGKCRHCNELLDRLWRMLVAFESQLSDIGRTQLISEVPIFGLEAQNGRNLARCG